MKVASLIGADLDCWVAKNDPRCEGLRLEWRNDHWVGVDNDVGVCIYITEGNLIQRLKLKREYDAEEYAPSRDWGQAGPIIEREGIAVWRGFNQWCATKPGGSDYPGNINYIDTDNLFSEGKGPTLLVAAMRCFVVIKYGEEVPA